jgi:hypothetical protein
LKIAALVQCHKRPDLVEALAERLSTPLWNMYLHVDRKTPIEPFLEGARGARTLPDRQDVYWCGIGHTEVTLRLLRLARMDPENTHFYVMSGQCYPFKADAVIEDALRREGCSGNLMNTVKMPVDGKPLSRLDRYHLMNIRNEDLRRRVNRVLAGLPKRNVKRLLRGMEPWGGSSWWMLNRRAVDEILAFVDDNPWCLKAFRYVFCPEECFFQTLVQHLGIVLDGGSPTGTKWIHGRAHPEDLTPEIIAELNRDWHWVLRKCV